MMTLMEANALATPILRSPLFTTSKTLQTKVDKIKKLFEGFQLTNAFKLNQFEILDAEKEKAFQELEDMYQAELNESALPPNDQLKGSETKACLEEIAKDELQAKKVVLFKKILWWKSFLPSG